MASVLWRASGCPSICTIQASIQSVLPAYCQWSEMMMPHPPPQALQHHTRNTCQTPNLGANTRPLHAHVWLVWASLGERPLQVQWVGALWLGLEVVLQEEEIRVHTIRDACLGMCTSHCACGMFWKRGLCYNTFGETSPMAHSGSRAASAGNACACMLSSELFEKRLLRMLA